MDKVLPIFKTTFSFRSILTVNEPGDYDPEYPVSIFDIYKMYGMERCFIVDDTMSGYILIDQVCKKHKIPFTYGLRITFCSNVEDKSEASFTSEHKVNVVARNFNGYQKLIKLISYASKEGFYYEPRLDFNQLDAHWNSKDLLIMIPFYDSYLFNNTLKGYTCTPNIQKYDPVYISEFNDLPFDKYLDKKIRSSVGESRIIKAKSIYYEKREDFLSYMTFKCATKNQGRSTIDKPEMEHMCSSEFCAESWKEQNAQ